VRLYPDIVWQVGGSPGAVIDAKYKAEKPRGYPNADLYQLLAYCTVLGLRTGHLVYARGNEEPTRHVIRDAGIEIICHALDLDQPQKRSLPKCANSPGQYSSSVTAGPSTLLRGWPVRRTS
jgi:5-methylcytosine-specific restriction enzyme subunit McrC